MKLVTNNIKTIDNSLHVLILIAGTTDPINYDINGKARSYGTTTQEVKSNPESYSNVPINYWDKEFKEQLEALDKKYVNLVLFPFHGWTGDNSAENREIAGQYLINRLCGANGEKPYYEKTWQNKEITFHFLGHSHGGNVINEMTQQISRLGSKWPEKWKIKSLIYLSTPFFKKLHQVKVDESFFHKDAEVFHAHCDFDLTQRMLADFSMEALARVLISNEMEMLGKSIQKLLNYEFPEISYKIEDVDKRWYGVDLELVIPYSEGREFYNKFIELFKDVQNVLNALDKLVIQFSKEIDFELSDKIKKDLGKELLRYKRTIIPANSAKSIKDMIKNISQEIQKNIDSFQSRYNIHEKSKANYIIRNIVEDFKINKLVDLLLVFLNINPTTLESEEEYSIWNILYEILDFNIHTFDNTYIKPDIQFKGTFLETKISDFDATYLDQYNNKKEKVNFYKFISYIENIEEKYEKEANQTNLLDLIFTLIVGQFGKSSYSYNGFNFGTTFQIFAKWWKINRISKLDFKASEFEKRLFQLADIVKNFETIFKARYFGSLSDSKDSNEKIGSIPYFLIESHSTSRRKLHKKIEEFLEKIGAKK